MDPLLLSGPAAVVAPRLLGATLVRTIGDDRIRARIVEVEAYDQTDPASHSFAGKTTRTAPMFGPAGHMYVYLSYGLHYCCNVVVGPSGQGAAVLIRAVEILDGQQLVAENRPGIAELQRTNGPGKLCQALGISLEANNHDLSKPPIELQLQPELAPEQIVETVRIGISKAQDKPWRFYIRNNPHVSRP